MNLISRIKDISKQWRECAGTIDVNTHITFVLGYFKNEGVFNLIINDRMIRIFRSLRSGKIVIQCYTKNMTHYHSYWEDVEFVGFSKIKFRNK